MNLPKKAAAIAIAVAMIFSFAACSADENNSSDISDTVSSEVSEESYTAESTETDYTYTDALGREVNITSHERVACLMGSFADMWCIAGGKESLVASADDTWTGFDLDLSDTVQNLGQIKEPNLEVLLESEPDLVFASSKMQSNTDMLETLEKAGISVVYLDVTGFEDYLSVLKMMTDLTGDNKAYEKNGEALKTQIEEAKSRQDGSEPSVCIIRVAGTAVSVKGSDDTVLSEMCKDLGCKNIADEHESLLENLSMETIIEADPDFIFVVYQGTDEEASSKVFEENVSSNEAWSGLSAVKNGNFYVMDRTLYNLKPNARWGEAYEKLADIIYP